MKQVLGAFILILVFISNQNAHALPAGDGSFMERVRKAMEEARKNGKLPHAPTQPTKPKQASDKKPKPPKPGKPPRPPGNPPTPNPNPQPRPEPGPVVDTTPPEVMMMDVTYSGTGCPEGTASIVLSPDQRVLSALFDQFLSQAGPSSGLQRDIKSCELIVPIEISNGRYQAKIMRADYRGVASLPAGTNLAVIGSYRFSSPEYPNIPMQSMSFRSTAIMGPAEEDYHLVVEPNTPLGTGPSGQPMAIQTTWSSCASRLNMHLSATLMANNQTLESDAIGSVDSIDAAVTPGVEYQIQWRKCGE